MTYGCGLTTGTEAMRILFPGCRCSRRKAGLVPLSQVADLSEGRGPSEIDRFNRQRLVTIYANLENLDLGSATQQVEAIVKGHEASAQLHQRSYRTGKADGRGHTEYAPCFHPCFCLHVYRACCPV